MVLFDRIEKIQNLVKSVKDTEYHENKAVHIKIQSYGFTISASKIPFVLQQEKQKRINIH